jgi:hypothetical protein
MSIRSKKFRSALKHAAYSTTALLPGEDPAAFKKLHQGLIAELSPNGPLEEDMVATIARLLWRKQNLGTFRIAQQTHRRWSAIISEKVPSNTPPLPDINVLLGGLEIDPAAREAGYQSAEAQARAEFGSAYELFEMEQAATVEQLVKDLEVEEQLDAMIGRCLKQLLFVRGLKSISITPASAPRAGLSAFTKVA